MDAMHDLGGKQGFGAIRHQDDADPFHADWEKKANALYTFAVREGLMNMDEYRHAIERMDPRHYLSASYYERSLTGLATMLVEKGVVTRERLEELAGGVFPLGRPNGPGRGNAPDRRRFQPGDRVRVKDDYVSGHVRAPAYIRGKTGVVVHETPAYPFPDASAHGVPSEPEPTYDVRFDAAELWHDAADQAAVHVGVFQSYLEPAE